MFGIELSYLHLGSIAPAALIGTYIMSTRKGSDVHKVAGKIFMVLVFVSAGISLFMPAFVGPRFINHFGFIHLLSVLTLFSIPAAYFAIRRGDVKIHQRYMILVYGGGIGVAGFFAFMPGRMLGSWVFS